MEYIQVGAFAGMDFDYLYLPSTFKNASYNVSADEYLYYIGAINEEGVTGTNESRAFNLYASDGSTTRYGVAFVDTLHLLERVVIDQAAKPSELSVDAIQGWVRYVTWNNYTALVFDDEDKVVFTGEITRGETVTVRVRAIYEINGEYNTYSVSGIMSGGVLTEQARF